MKETTLKRAIAEREAAYRRFLSAQTPEELNESKRSLLLWSKVLELQTKNQESIPKP